MSTSLVQIKTFYITIFFLLFYSTILPAQEQKISRLIDQLKTVDTDKEQQLDVLFKVLDENAFSLSHYEQKAYLIEALGVAQKEGLKNLELRFIFKILTLYDSSSSSSHAQDSAVQYATLGLSVAKDLKSYHKIAEAYNILGVFARKQQDPNKAIGYYELAIENAKQSDNPGSATYALSNLSNIYFDLGESERAVHYTKEGLEMAKLLDNKKNIYYNFLFKYSDLIKYYNSLEKIDSAYFYIDRGLEVEATIDTMASKLIFEGVLFNFHQACIGFLIKEKKFESAEQFYQKLSSNRSMETPLGYLLKIKYALGTGDIKRAGLLLEQASQDLKDTKSTYRHAYINHRATYREKTKDYKGAISDYKTIKEVEDQWHKEQTIQHANYVQSRLGLKDKEKQIELLEKEKQISNLQSRYSMIGLAGFLMGLLFLLYQYRNLLKKNTLLKEQQKLIKKQSNKLQTISDQRLHFFSNVAHEFQTPLSIITGLAKKIRSLDKIEDTKSLLPIIIRNGTQLSEFTSQILDLAKNEETSYPVNQSYFHIGELIKYQIHELQYLANPKNITIELQNTLDKQVLFSDVHKFKTIIKNLVSNAIKFSPLNSRVKLKLNTVDKKNIAITISDDGKGIPKEDLSIIFDRFYQSNNEKEEGGFGIGLAICKEYTHALGGQIEAESILGKGSQFVLQVPTNINGQVIEESLIQKFPIEEYSEEKLLLNQNKQDKSILIIEDNLDFCKYLSSILASRYQLVFFHNGYDAFDYLKSDSPDLIITDWMLPEMDGLEFTKTLKKSLEGKRIPMLMLTARGMITDQLKALREGIDDYLVKTFDEETLIQRIENLLLHPSIDLSKQSLLNDTHSNPSNRIGENISKQDQKWLLQFEQAITPRIQAFELNLEEIAITMNMSVTHLGRKMKSITGTTPKKYIQEMRFWEARRMLELGLVDSVKAACYSVGFKDQSHFSKKFKDKFGTYPSDYFKAK